MNRQLFLAAALLSVYWIALPVPTRQPDALPSNVNCFTQTEAAPVAAEIPIGVLEQCSRLLPDDAELLADLGDRYGHSGQFQEAEASYQRALAIDPDYAEVRLRLATLMLRRGAVSGARQQADTALQVQPNRRALSDLVQP